MDGFLLDTPTWPKGMQPIRDKASLSPTGSVHLVGCPLWYISELLVVQMAETQTKEGGTDKIHPLDRPATTETGSSDGF